MAATAERTDPKLWDQVKTEVTKGDKGGSPGQWSARKAQMAVAEYKRRGGGYRGKKSNDNRLVQWTRDDRESQTDQHRDRKSPDRTPTKAALLQEARKRNIAGRSRMSKDALARVVYP